MVEDFLWLYGEVSVSALFKAALQVFGWLNTASIEKVGELRSWQVVAEVI
jgi:hypothetical protein